MRPSLAPLSLTAVPLDSKTIGPGRRIEWTPFEVSTNRPVDEIVVEAYPPPEVTIAAIAPLRRGERRPRVIVIASRALADRDLPVRFVLRPAEDDAPAVEVTSHLRVRAPNLSDAVPSLAWLPIALLWLAVMQLMARGRDKNKANHEP
jgi:hypothetical protein